MYSTAKEVNFTDVSALNPKSMALQNYNGGSKTFSSLSKRTFVETKETLLT